MAKIISLTERYKKLSPWLSSNRTIREKRRYLEEHLDLLAKEFEDFLEDLLTQYAEKPDEQYYLRSHLEILRDARARGGTITAVREAYVDLYSGLCLDLPPWLEE